MAIGTVTPAEWREITDPVSGLSLRQHTSYLSNSHHLYFTNPGWYDGGQRLLFGSDRGNRTNLFSLHLASGEITQVTDFAPVLPPRETSFLCVDLNPVRDEAYFWYDRELRALDLTTYEQRTLWHLPEGFIRSMTNCTADGKYVCTGIYQDLTDRISVDLNRNYVGFREIFAANPESRIMRVAADGSGVDCAWSENSWIGHINTSPTQPNILTFCHEGPWNEVDNRIWGLDLTTGKAWTIRKPEQGEAIGHEYWHADGVTVGYHGRMRDGRKFFGKVNYDDTGRFEVDFPSETGHIHSNDFSLIVGDGAGHIRLWQWNGESFDGPRALAHHHSSMKIQQAHPHPRFTSDGKQVIFTSDWTGYCQIYQADVPDFASLPEIP